MVNGAPVFVKETAPPLLVALKIDTGIAHSTFGCQLNSRRQLRTAN